MPREYRAPTSEHKLFVLSDDLVAVNTIKRDGVVRREIDYGAYNLIIVDEATLDLLGTPALSRVMLRDDLNLIRLNSWVFDPGLFGEPSELPSNRVQEPESFERQLYVVQFVGPVRDAWINAVTAGDKVRIVGPISNSAFVVLASAEGWRSLVSAASQEQGAVRWVGVYHPAYRISTDLEPALGSSASVDVVIQLVDHPQLTSTMGWIRQVASSVIGETNGRGLGTVTATVKGSDIVPIAQKPDILWIEPARTVELASERQAQIVAGNTAISGFCEDDVSIRCKSDATCAPASCVNREAPSAARYKLWLSQKGLTCAANPANCTGSGQNRTYGFVVDVTDAGFDLGSTTDVWSDFKTQGGVSRVMYAADYSFPPLGPQDEGAGHGTLVAATVGGDNSSSQDPFEDDDRYQYGLGIAPEVKLGSSRLLPSTTIATSTVELLIANAYSLFGARISNNSWNNGSNQYDLLAQKYDELVRDADENTTGNQEMTIVFAVDNDGPFGFSVHAPATAKNVISVGASESFWRPPPEVTDNKPGQTEEQWCDQDFNSDDARDMTFFSSRGPTADLRIKPDIVAPGTRVTGSASRLACDVENDPLDPCADAMACNVAPVPCCQYCIRLCGHVRDPFTTSASYMVAGGTSFAAPAIAGASALLRQFYLNNSWVVPSPAMTKAHLLGTTTYLTGTYVNDTLPSNVQGYGRVNLGTAFDGTPNYRLDQTHVFRDSGQLLTITGTISDPAKPLRVVLAWTDAPGMVMTDAYVNDLNLEVFFPNVEGDYLLFQGNFFSGENSKCVEVLGTPPPRPECVASPVFDTRNNAEAVVIPSGYFPTGTPYEIRIRAINITGNGLPGDAFQDPTDQDFALFVYNYAP